jgi:hypothetical protein
MHASVRNAELSVLSLSVQESERLVREYEDSRPSRTSFSHDRARPRDGEEQDEDGRDMSLLVAQTALILTFSWVRTLNCAQCKRRR